MAWSTSLVAESCDWGVVKRGQRVSDMVAQTPDERILVVDAKAYKNPFDASTPNLRALGEYVTLQKKRQSGQVEVSAALVVADSFEQSAKQLNEVSRVFTAEYRLPVGFMPVESLAELVQTLVARPWMRPSINWALLLCGGGLVSVADVRRELASAESQRLPRDTTEPTPTSPTSRVSSRDP